ncbi:MAG: glucan endo-1,3-beta-D-glucosidase, partial [Treponema sp.]|nr:glucan endo-1,3-beta-D-glucosidase [Treponema sp.]
MVFRKRLALVAVFAVVLSSGLLFAQNTPSKYTEADLIWKDDFNGSKLNKDDWNYETHKPGWVNAELQSYGESDENTYLKDGYLVIQPVRKEDKNGNVSYTSGRINT